MLHIFISETTPEEKQRKLLRFEEKGSDFTGYYGISTNYAKGPDAFPVYYLRAGHLREALSGGGISSSQWSSLTGGATLSYYYETNRDTFFPTYLYWQWFGFSLC